ncbi:hypothetical protein [Microbacterium album]|nr:hypothetical protein [Microbacterium album]
MTVDHLPAITRAINYGETVPRLLCDEHDDIESIVRNVPGGEPEIVVC